jgi:hypothetical protein
VIILSWQVAAVAVLAAATSQAAVVVQVVIELQSAVHL